MGTNEKVDFKKKMIFNKKLENNFSLSRIRKMSSVEEDHDEPSFSDDEIYGTSDVEGDVGDDVEEIEEEEIDETEVEVGSDDEDDDVLPLTGQSVETLLSSLALLGFSNYATVSQPVQSAITPNVPVTPSNTPSTPAPIAQSFLFQPTASVPTAPAVTSSPAVKPSSTRSPKKGNVKVVNFTKEGLNELTAEDVKEYCRLKAIKGYSNKNKSALVDYVLTYPLNESFSYKSPKSDVTITITPVGSAQSAQNVPITPVPQVVNQANIVPPTVFTPTYMFASPTVEASSAVPVPAPQLPEAAKVSAPVIPTIPEEKVSYGPIILENSVNPAVNEFRTNLTNQSSAGIADNQKIATEINKAVNEQFLGVKYQEPSNLPVQISAQV